MSYRIEKRTPVTVRLPLARLRRLMRARKIATQSALINTLLEEEVERIASREVLRETAGTVASNDFDDRLL
jgi:hypothetical protein